MSVGIVKPRRLNSKKFYWADFNFTANELQAERALVADLQPKKSSAKNRCPGELAFKIEPPPASDFVGGGMPPCFSRRTLLD
jgi:hypothetical protein